MADTIIPTSLATARTQVLSLCNDADVGFFTGTEIDNWIKEGCVDISSKAHACEAVDHITLAADTLSYTDLDTLGSASVSRIVKVAGMVFSDGSGKYKGMVRTTPRLLGHLAQKAKGEPKYYLHWNKTIYLMPLTTSSVVAAGGKAMVFFSKITDDITELSDWYQPAAILFAFSRALLKDGKVASSNSVYSRYLNGLMFHRADLFDLPADVKEDFRLQDR